MNMDDKTPMLRSARSSGRKRNKDDRSSIVVLAFRFGMILLVLADSTLAACRSGRYPQLYGAESGKGDAAILSTALGLL